MNITFRVLRADEVDVRPNTTTGNTVSLLLYQDARCARSILDETVGNTNWQSRYYSLKSYLKTYREKPPESPSFGARDEKKDKAMEIVPVDQIYCEIGIRDESTNTWVWKSDTGSSIGNTEPEKTLASDCFKRAAFAWGIGKELYTAPPIKIELKDKDYFNGKVCQSFHVGEMKVSDGTIVYLTILDKWNNERFRFQAESNPVTTISEENVQRESDGMNDNERMIDEFYSSRRGLEDEHLLTSFYNYWLGKGRGKSESRIANFKGSLDPARLFKRWVQTERK